MRLRQYRPFSGLHKNIMNRGAIIPRLYAAICVLQPVPKINGLTRSGQLAEPLREDGCTFVHGGLVLDQRGHCIRRCKFPALRGMMLRVHIGKEVGSLGNWWHPGPIPLSLKILSATEGSTMEFSYIHLHKSISNSIYRLRSLHIID
jgi:hypothetical protein